MRFLAFAAFALTIGRPASGQSFTFCHADGPRRNFSIVFYDAGFLFTARDYGNSRDAGGNTEPGFFVHSKEHNQWINVLAVSTRDGRFGSSFSDDPEANQRLRMVSVSWDFRPLATMPFAILPLKTSGSIALPDSIVYDASSGRYALHFMSSWRAIPSATTTLYIQRSDLVAAFAERASSAVRCGD